MESLQVLSVVYLDESEGSAPTAPLGGQQHDLLLRAMELQALEEDQSYRREPLAKPSAHRLCIVNGEQLGREDHCQAPVLLEEGRSVDQQGRPGRGQTG